MDPKHSFAAPGGLDPVLKTSGLTNTNMQLTAIALQNM